MLSRFTEISSCPVCRNHIAVKFLFSKTQPLSTLGWPESEQEAKEMSRLPINFVQCVTCSHIWNRSFNYDDIPYQTIQ